MSQRGRGIFRLIAAAYAMLDAIHRMFRVLFGHPQPIDWWLLAADVAIVLLIIWLDVPEKLHKKRCAKIAKELQPFAAKGAQLQRSVPNPSQRGFDAESQWTKEVNEWSSEVEQFLSKRSAKAAIAFSNVVVDAGSITHRARNEKGYVYPLSEIMSDKYQEFQAKLNNLHRVMEQSELYF